MFCSKCMHATVHDALNANNTFNLLTSSLNCFGILLVRSCLSLKQICRDVEASLQLPLALSLVQFFLVQHCHLVQFKQSSPEQSWLVHRLVFWLHLAQPVPKLFWLLAFAVVAHCQMYTFCCNLGFYHRAYSSYIVCIQHITNQVFSDAMSNCLVPELVLVQLAQTTFQKTI